MTSLQSVVGALPGYIVYFTAASLTAAQLAILLLFIRKNRPDAHLFLALTHFLAGLLFLSVLLDYSYNALIEGQPEILYGFELRLLSLPWLMYAAAEGMSAMAVLLHGRMLRRDRNTHLSADAIRQTVNLLPTALMISDPDGTVLLANLQMTELCRALTGEALSDAQRFIRYVGSVSDEDRLAHTHDGKAWQFTQSRITLNGREYDQLTAADRTDKHRVTKELRDKNDHLREVQYRMRMVAAKERSLVAAREVMNARMTVHNRMGGVLLSGKYYLDHPEDVKEEELLRLLEYNSHFLLGEAEQPDRERDPLEDALQTARRIGVSVAITGDIPNTEPARRLIAQAVEQCAANAVRHAGGDRLTVVITGGDTEVSAVFSNNGSPPKGPIVETGGLAVLRRTVEGAGGAMAVKSEPAFRLSIILPKKA